MANSLINMLRPTWIRIGLLALAYAVVGRLALLLAIPPGYATGIFPSAGIAVVALLLGGRQLWPGVFLGSLLMNVSVGVEQGALAFSGLLVALCASTGATFQALIGSILIKRFVGEPLELARERDIFYFMVLAGPVACLINASFGAVSLVTTGAIDPGNFGYSWFTWWVGDCIGVFIAAPLMMIVFAQPRDLWSTRQKTVALPMVLLVILLVGLFVQASKLELESTRQDFREITVGGYHNLSSSVKVYADSIEYLDRLVSASEYVSREEFRRFVAFPLQYNQGTHALSWNQWVPDTARTQYEQSIAADGVPGFEIKERDQNGELIRAEQRDSYVAVTYIEPMTRNLAALGYDVSSNPTRRAALEKARDTGKTTATSRIKLVQGSTEQNGFLLFKAAYRGVPESVADRRSLLKGFSVGVFQVGEIVNAAFRGIDSGDFVFNVYEQGSDGDLHLYGPQSMPAAMGYISQQYELNIGDRTWLIRFWPSGDYVSSHRGWQAWALLTGGLLFVSLLGAFLLITTGRSFHIEKLVNRRTAELSGILNTAIEAIIILDAKGTIETVNPAGEALFGYGKAELTGGSVQRILPDVFAETSLAGQGARSGSVAIGRIDSSAVRKDQSTVDVEVAISQLTIPGRTLYTAIVHDLTERKKLDRMKDEFVSTVSHELRTPLTSIKGSLGLIVGGVLDNKPDEAMKMLQLSYDNCDRLGRLIDDLLEFNKIQASAIQLDLEVLSVRELLEKALAANEGFAARFSVSLQLAHVDDAVISGDENRLMQGLSNLISNAVKYSPQEAAVRLSANRQGDRVCIAVADSGPGIPKAFQDSVFDKFTQADSSDTRRVGGTGLGMAITKSLIELHGGELRFTSDESRGTTFYIELPSLNR